MCVVGINGPSMRQDWCRRGCSNNEAERQWPWQLPEQAEDVIETLAVHRHTPNINETQPWLDTFGCGLTACNCVDNHELGVECETDAALVERY